MRTFFVVLALAVAGFSTLSSQADEVYTFVVKKQEEKAKNRWSLSEWLETRDKMRMMDLWLALHSPSPYEFYLGGGYVSAKSQSGVSQTGWNFQAAAYASIFGLGVERAGFKRVTDSTGLFHLRVFGFHAQATNITLLGGIRSANRVEGDFRGATAGVSSTIYFGKHFGVDGRFLHFYESVPEKTGQRLGGNTYEGGAFIDFSFLRVFGRYFNETNKLKSAGITRSGTNSGGVGGLRFFF